MDFNEDNAYTVPVVATSGSGARKLSTKQIYTVLVTDVDEPPAKSIPPRR